jgi:molybdopterin biosynthesis enzyme
MTLTEDIVNSRGQVLLEKGTELNDDNIKLLLASHIDTVDIFDDEIVSAF